MTPLYFIIAILILTPLALAGCSLAPWVPTRAKDFERINRHLQLKNGSVFYDLGCGDGRVCRYIAKHNPDAEVIGIEMALPMYLIAVLLQCIFPIRNLAYIYGNALKRDLSDADGIYTYALIDTINNKLKSKFLLELKAGCRIVSYHFAIRDWPGKQAIHTPEERGATLFVYEV